METTNFKHGTTDAMACSCCGKGTPTLATLMIAEEVRAHFDAAVFISSGPRCTIHNKAVGGSKQSSHLIDENGEADAIDISVAGTAPTKVHEFLKSRPYASSIGLGLYIEKKFVHVDVRGYAARWRG